MADDIADLDQAEMLARAGSEGQARIIGGFFTTLIASGLERNEAMMLTITWVETTFERSNEDE